MGCSTPLRSSTPVRPPGPARSRLCRGAAAATALLVLTGCSGEGTPSSPVASTAASPAAAAPSAGATAAVDPVIASGDRVLVTDTAALPGQLLARVDQPVTWVNKGTAPMRVMLLHDGTQSPLLAPGVTWSYTSDATITIGYRVSGGAVRRGSVQVEPGDD